MNCKLLKRENYLSSAEAKSIEISIGRTRDLDLLGRLDPPRPVQIAGVWVRPACVAIKVRYK